jgi:hypothetical protein
MHIDRMDVIFKKCIQEGLTTQDIDYLSQSTRTRRAKAIVMDGKFGQTDVDKMALTFKGIIQMQFIGL